MNTRDGHSSRTIGRGNARRSSPLARLFGVIAEALSSLGDWLAPPGGPRLQPIPVRAQRRPMRHPGDRPNA